MLSFILKRTIRPSSFVRMTGYRFSRLVTHHETPENNDDTYFEFTPENYKIINSLLKRYPDNYKKSAVLYLLHLAQKQNGNFLTLAAMNKVAKILEMTNLNVYEVAAFYSMFNREKVGKIRLQICGTTPCLLCGARDIMKACEDHLGIKMGGTTKDGMFTLEEVECLGVCANAPMMQVNNEKVYEDLTPEIMPEMLEKFRKGEEIKAGPQTKGRKNAEGPLGRTTLNDLSRQNIDRNFDKDVNEWKQALEKAKEQAKNKK
uniref:Hydrogenosomal NADH dehydrogenase 24 kDa subunit n=1 Tax=Nyctotherus ovalis TaxID=70075 RepID=Q5DLW2_NYCOV|nr:hydrogenosomal NADH dehydrogenase 24 kDa subunit [Nyctotherus ovalis]